MAQFTINQKALLVELAASEPLLKKEAEAIMRQQLFDPAVATLQLEFLSHPVTEELKAGADGTNISDNLNAPFSDPPNRTGKNKSNHRDDYADPNLFAFIGFDKGTDPTKPIEERLNPANKDGPKLKYAGMDRDRLSFRFQVSAPDFDAIQEATPLPWAPGISWAKRIEQGLPGIGHYLNAIRGGERGAGSASGKGIQVEAQLRGGNFKPTKYLSDLFNAFLRRASSGRDR